MTAALRSWIDRNILMIGVVMLFAGVAATMLAAIRHLALPINAAGEIVLFGLGVNMFAALASPLAYNSVLLIVAGLLLKRGERTLVGFENTPAIDLFVEGPDETRTVWLGKRFGNAFDAEVAADALARRLNIPGKQ